MSRYVLDEFDSFTDEDYDKISLVMDRQQNKKEKDMKEYKQLRHFTVKKILDEYSIDNGTVKKLICKDAELDIYRWLADKGWSPTSTYGADGAFFNDLKQLTIQGVNAIQWLAENTPYYEEVEKEPKIGDVVKMCDMKSGFDYIIEEPVNDIKCKGWLVWKNGYNGRIHYIDPKNNDIGTFNAMAEHKVRLCELEIREKVPGEKVVEFENPCCAFNDCSYCPLREEECDNSRHRAKVILTPKKP